MLSRLVNRIFKRPAVMVLGMHRSGTSALARTLALAGGTLPRTLFDAVVGDNELGYWESWRLIDYHESLFRRMGKSMLDGSPIEPDWFDSEDARKAESELVAIVCDEWRDGLFATSTPWIIKEPRIARLLPLWRRVLRRIGRSPVAVHMLREPCEVAASLLRRPEIASSSFTHLDAERAWLEHVLLAERNTRDLPRTFVSMDLLLNDWRTVVRRVGELLKDGMPQAEASGADIEHFLRPTLRNHRLGSASHDVSSDVARVRDALLDAARRGIEPDRWICDLAYEQMMTSTMKQHACGEADRSCPPRPR